MKVTWNLFAEGECDEEDVFTMVLPGETYRRIYIKRQCPSCGEMMWIPMGLNCCEQCLP